MPRVGIEPTTRGFSVRCSTPELPRQISFILIVAWFSVKEKTSGLIGIFDTLFRSKYGGACFRAVLWFNRYLYNFDYVNDLLNGIFIRYSYHGRAFSVNYFPIKAISR